MEAELPEQREQHLFDQVILTAASEEVGEKVAPLLLGGRERAVRAHRQTRHRLRTDMAEVAVPVLSVERLEPLLRQHRIELT